MFDSLQSLASGKTKGNHLFISIIKIYILFSYAIIASTVVVLCFCRVFYNNFRLVDYTLIFWPITIVNKIAEA